jgi:hypothetical protein
LKTGAEPKKVALLAGILVAGVALVLYENDVFSGGSSSPRSASVTAPPPEAAVAAIPTHAKVDRRASKNGNVQEFKIRQGVETGQPEPDPATIDPTLRLDLLAKIQQVELPAQLRNIFQYGPPPAPPAPPKPVELPKNPPKIAINQPPAPPPGPPPPPPAPVAPTMTFKYYGYKVSKSDGRKEAFLLDGEEIIVAGENDEMKRGRYKIVRIGVSSITIEDTQFKSSQTLPLQEDAPPA